MLIPWFFQTIHGKNGSACEPLPRMEEFSSNGEGKGGELGLFLEGLTTVLRPLVWRFHQALAVA